ncbi:MAG: type I-E CRISPR-associated protein Cse1/CasA [Pelistega sp.]|nr:type I-E CRISPR-associated protein Cse1/CasA [Pelistega sp.]
MNLLVDDFFFFRKKDGSFFKGNFLEILNPEVVDFAMPREDFQVSAYVFTIAVLQTVFAPEDQYEWQERYELQADSLDQLTQELSAALQLIQHAFNVIGDGPLFMQDFDLLEQANEQSVSALLIESPGENTIKNNTDHFVKRGTAECISIELLIWALFTMQSMAPSGGAGHRVSLRGGGPLTTIIKTGNEDSTLWQQVWLNVINREHWQYPKPDLQSISVFPWLGPTLESKTSKVVYAKDVHPLHMYWAMPRRIRLNENLTKGICQVSGYESEHIITSYRTQNYGYNYGGTWSFPLTPYRWNPKKPDEDKFSIKGQLDVHYNQWHMLSHTDSEEGYQCATNISHYYKLLENYEELVRRPRIWASGYSLDNMKAKGWSSVYLPLMKISMTKQDDYFASITEMHRVAKNIVYLCRSHIKAALISERSNIKGGFEYVDTVFWQRSQGTFFELATLLQHQDNYTLTNELASTWFNYLRALALDLYDEYAFSGDVETSLVLLESRSKERQKLQRAIYSKNKHFLIDYKLLDKA